MEAETWLGAPGPDFGTWEEFSVQAVRLDGKSLPKITLRRRTIKK
jgi:hypothetical protein